MSSRAATWDALAGQYDAERADDATYHWCVRAAADATLSGHPRRVLDIGCGTGLTTRALSRGSCCVVAADYSAQSLRILRGKALTTTISQADVTALPFTSGSFDAVLCANTLQHLPPSLHAVAAAELQRVLVPNGRLVVTVHHYSRAKAEAGWIKVGKPGQPGVDYIFRFTRPEVAVLFPQARILALGLAAPWDRIEPWLPSAIRERLAHAGHGHMLLATACMQSR